MKKFYQQSNSGYALLISVVAIGAIATVVAVAMIYITFHFSASSYIYNRSSLARGYADACGEEALQQIRDNSLYTGTSTLTFAFGSCSFIVTNTGGTNRTIVSTGTSQTIVRKISIAITAITPSIVIDSWKEVAN